MGTRVVQKGPEESLGSMELFYSVSWLWQTTVCIYKLHRTDCAWYSIRFVIGQFSFKVLIFNWQA
jgi:hypothetical protein